MSRFAVTDEFLETERDSGAAIDEGESDMQTRRLEFKFSRILKCMPLLVGVALFAGGCSKAVPNDGTSAVVKHFDNLRAMRYCEVFLIGGTAFPRNLEAAFYNTTDLNNAADPRDTCPAGVWSQVNPEELKKRYDVFAVFKNGPRGWANDWIELPVGELRTFNGLQAHWMGVVQLPKTMDVNKKGSSAYKPTVVARKSKMGFAKGQPVFILEDPSGMPWVMQAFSDIVDPNLTYADLQTLDKKLHLAPGWKFRVKTLDQDLMIQAIDGHAHIVQDDLENTYDACFEQDGQKACSNQP
jgi:hypothetical protein